MSNPAAPKMKNLGTYLQNTKLKAEQRRQLATQEIFIQNLLQTRQVITKDDENESAVIDSDPYSAMGPAYKNTFLKMIGAIKVAKTKNMPGLD